MQYNLNPAAVQSDMVYTNQAFNNTDQGLESLLVMHTTQSPLPQGIRTAVPPTEAASPQPPNSTATFYPQIGFIYSTSTPRKYLFKCNSPRCGKTFQRSYEFDRHYNGAHALEKTVYWCPVEGCPRSEGAGNQPFPRNDKMTDHLRKVHPGGSWMLRV